MEKKLTLAPLIIGLLLILGGIYTFFAPWETFLDIRFLTVMGLIEICSGLVCLSIFCVCKLLEK